MPGLLASYSVHLLHTLYVSDKLFTVCKKLSDIYIGGAHATVRETCKIFKM